jgi:hypothetical protein
MIMSDIDLTHHACTSGTGVIRGAGRSAPVRERERGTIKGPRSPSWCRGSHGKLPRRRSLRPAFSIASASGLLPNCCRCSMGECQAQCSVGDFLRSSFSLPWKHSGWPVVVATASSTRAAPLMGSTACWYARAAREVLCHGVLLQPGHAPSQRVHSAPLAPGAAAPGSRLHRP